MLPACLTTGRKRFIFNSNEEYTKPTSINSLFVVRRKVLFSG